MSNVRVNSLYAYNPVGVDVYAPTVHIPVGTVVRVVNQHGCPPANTMGHCFIAYPDNNDFIGLVLCNSLHPVVRRNGKYYMKDEE